jgi:hypothetical protein
MQLSKPLPHTVEYEGVSYELNTDYRVWLRALDALQEQGVLIYEVFKEIPPDDVIPQIMPQIEAFISPPAELPRSRGTNSAEVLSFKHDGALIYAAFWQAYGINLTTAQLHWHEFKALLANIPDDTRLASVMGYRAYKPTKKDHDAAMRELQAAWRIPDDNESEEKSELLEWAASNFDF